MGKRRIYEMAKEQGLSTQELAEMLRAGGVEVRSNLSSVEETDVTRVLAARLAPAKEPAVAPRRTAAKPAAGKGAAPKAPAQVESSVAAVQEAAPVVDKVPEASAAEAQAIVQPSTAAPAETAPNKVAEPAPPRPRGPRIVATAEELKVQEAARVAARPPVPRKDHGRGRGPRLNDLPTVVGPGVPLRKGVKPPVTVHRKGEEPPPAPPRAKAPPAGPAVRGPGGPPRDQGPRPAGGSGAPRTGTTLTPREGADRPPRPPRPAGTSTPRVEPAAAEKAGDRAPARRGPVTQEKPGERAGRVWRADDKPTRRRVVIDSQAGRKPGGKPGIRDRGRGGLAPVEAERPAPKRKAVPGMETPVTLASGATVKDFADAFDIGASEIIKTMMKLGDMVTITQSLSDDAIMILAEEFERKVEIQHAEEEEAVRPTYEDDPADLVGRAPVVTIMGHVDHGKTSLLDAIRETAVAKSEAGGITQHIGAYQVQRGNKLVTFIDTPGHEAFTAMRARGAKITDVAVIVVAANDGVMPQTIEAIDHARAAEVPIVVAVNKMDLPDANPDRVRQQLSDMGLVPEEWGGDTIMVNVSAKKRLNLDELVDMFLLVAEMKELKGNPTAPASGVVIEAQLDVGRGPAATILVQRGTLHVGDALVSGEAHGKVKAMFDFRGDVLTSAGPSVPVQILGFNTVPAAGDFMKTAKDERDARQQAELRTARLRMEMMAKGRAAATSLDDFYRRLKEGEVKELALIIKGDVGGSVEALEEALGNVSHPEVKVRVIHSGVGGINESDIILAAASNAVVIGFNVRPSVAAKALAESEGVDVRTYRVIYKAIEDIQSALVGMLEPDHVEEELGNVEVRQLFRSSKVGTIAGCFVHTGKITRSAKVRVVREGKIIFEGGINSLKRFAEDTREVLAGYECGLHVEGFDDLKEGDIIEAYEIKEVARTS